MRRKLASPVTSLLFVVIVFAVGSGTSAFAPLISTQSTLRKSGHHGTTVRHSSVPFIMMSTDNMPGDEHSSVFDDTASSDMPNAMPMVEKKETKKSMNTTPALVSMLKKVLNTDGLKLTSMQLVAAAAAFAFVFTPINNADAAMSGGRMGGSFSAPSAPRQTISRPMPSSSSSYSRGYSRGYSSGYISRPSVTIAPSVGYGYSPFMSPLSPFAAPRVYGGPGVISLSRGPSFFDLIFFGGLFLVASQAFLKSSTETSSSVDTYASALGSGTSVVQLSVALEVPNRDDRNSILSVLDRLSRTAKTDSRVGIQNLTSQVALELLRRQSSIVSASSSHKHFNNRDKALREFRNRSIKERSKFETETVSKYGGVDYGSKLTTAPRRDGTAVDYGGDKATMAVVTFVLAIDGDQTKLNRINSVTDVEQALRQIASDAKAEDCLQMAEILWCPEDRSETLSVRDIIADYPQLRAI